MPAYQEDGIMSDIYSAKSDLYHKFVLCIKYRSEQYDYAEYPFFYDLLKNEGWFQQTELARISDDLVPSGRYLASGKILSKSSNESMAILEHESGAEIWIIPLTTFVAGAIATGVIGNAAYDLIRKIHSMMVKSRQQSDSGHEAGRHFINHDDQWSKFSTILRTPDYETIDISQLPAEKQLDLIQRVISYRLLQLNIDLKEKAETKSLEKRIEGLENHLKEINLSHLQLIEEFQKERTVWRNRTANLSARLNRLENANNK